MAELVSSAPKEEAAPAPAPVAAKKGKKGPASEVPRFGRVKSNLKVRKKDYYYSNVTYILSYLCYI